MDRSKLYQNYGTLSEILKGLEEMGYTHDFNVEDNCIVCQKVNLTLSPEEFTIDRTIRLDGDSDPDYQSILYAISSPKYGIKGTLLNGYGTSADEKFTRMISALETNRKNKQTEEVTSLHSIISRANTENLIQEIKNNWSNGKHSISVFKSELKRIMMLGLRKDNELKPHMANGLLTIQVLEGSIHFTAGSDTITVAAGDIISLSQDIQHSVVAKEDSILLLNIAVFSK